MYTAKGVITALITPFTKDADLCIECLKTMIEFQVEKGVIGLYLSGTYGEGVITPFTVREKLFVKAIEFAPGKVILLPHVGGFDIESIVKLAKIAKDLGYPAVSIIGPLYHTPTKMGLIKFYNYVAKKVDVPIIIYNNKNRQGYNISPDDYEAISKEVPHVVGIKDTSYDVEQLLELVKRFGSKHFIAGAGDNLLLYTFVIGAHAHICGISNLFPEIAVELYNAVTNNNYRKALEIQYKIVSFRKTAKKYNIELQEILRIMLKLRGIESGYPPLQLSMTFTDKQLLELKEIIEQMLSQ